MAILVTTGEAAFRWEAPRVALERPYAAFGGTVFPRNYDLSADGKRFLVIKEGSAGSAPPINVVLNWVEELKRLVPTN